MNALKKVLLDELQAVLDVDPIQLAENTMGKTCDEDDATMGLALGLNMIRAEEKQKLFNLNDDTHMMTAPDNYLRICREEGFTGIYLEVFGNDILYILWHPDGILLRFDTYGKYINACDMYFNWKPNDLNKMWGPCNFSGGFHAPNPTDKSTWTLIASLDVREGLRFNLHKLREAGRFVTPWVEAPFLWLLNHADTKDENYDYEKINRERIAKLPVSIQGVINVESR